MAKYRYTYQVMKKPIKKESEITLGMVDKYSLARSCLIPEVIANVID